MGLLAKTLLGTVQIAAGATLLAANGAVSATKYVAKEYDEYQKFKASTANDEKSLTPKKAQEPVQEPVQDPVQEVIIHETKEELELEYRAIQDKISEILADMILVQQEGLKYNDIENFNGQREFDKIAGIEMGSAKISRLNDDLRRVVSKLTLL